MSALAERIIAARDAAKRHRDPILLDVMADAVNALVGQEALLKAENAARLELQRLAADECARADTMRDLLTRARWYVTDALDAHEHTDGRDLLKEIDAAIITAARTQGQGEGLTPEEATAQVHRVCRIMSGDCMGCPASELIGGDECQRGCYLVAVEVINTVETGNPWRKTEGVSAPWTVFPNTGPHQ